MKKAMSLFLVMILMTPAVLYAKTPAQTVETSPVPSPTGTAEERREQARRSDDLGQSSTATDISLPEVESYDQLLTAIREVRSESQARVEKAVEQEKVREAWETGKLIHEHVLQNKKRAEYGKRVIVKLAKDLGTSETELKYMRQFAEAYPTCPTSDELSWSKYRELLSINDAEERKALAEQAALNQWTHKELRAAVKKAKTGKKDSDETGELLPPSKPGKPGTYKMVKATVGPYAGELVLDLGFSNTLSLSSVMSSPNASIGDPAFKEDDIVTSSEDAKGLYTLEETGSLTSETRSQKGDIRHPSSDIQSLYTYNAYVVDVLDGDTLKVIVDLGFGIRSAQTLRLKGIDCPEILTRAGKEAKAFVAEMLQMPGHEPRATDKKDEPVIARSDEGATRQSILIKTVKSDKYDRYLADVFITNKNGKEIYLNNELLEKGLAVKVNE